MLRNLTALLFSALLLSACGPVYHTVYNYTPPKSRDGMACVMQCDNTRNECKRANQSAREAADLKRHHCEERRAREEKETGKESHISCSFYSHDEDCDGNYRTCYQTCGGHISSHQECSAFCN